CSASTATAIRSTPSSTATTPRRAGRPAAASRAVWPAIGPPRSSTSTSIWGRSRRFRRRHRIRRPRWPSIPASPTMSCASASTTNSLPTKSGPITDRIAISADAATRWSPELDRLYYTIMLPAWIALAATRSMSRPDDEVRVMFTTDRRSLILGSAAVVVSSALSRSYAQAPTGPYKLDPLPYPTNKNEPSIDAQTMEIHHDRHHAAYVNNLNGVMAQQPDLAQRPLLELLTRLDSVPEAVRTAVRNNGGGHANHTMFW